MKMTLVISCLFFAVVIDEILAVGNLTDISISNATITSTTEEVVFIAGVPTTVTMEITITNEGENDITGSSDNFDFQAISIKSQSDFESRTVGSDVQGTVNLDQATKLSDPLPGNNATLVIANIVLTLTLPGTQTECEEQTHLCVRVTTGSGATFEETETDNNDMCIPYGVDDIVDKYCQDIDLQVEDFSVDNSDTLIYWMGLGRSISIDITLRNDGSDAIDDATDIDNYLFNVYVIVGDDFGQRTGEMKFPTNTDGVDNIGSGIVENGTAIFTGVVTTILIVPPNATCETFTKFCIEVSRGRDAEFYERIDNNNELCKDFGTEPGQVGQKSCNRIEIDLDLTSVEVTTNEDFFPLDEVVAVSVTTSVTNSGQGDLPIASDDNNFVVKKYLTNSDVLNTDTFKIEITENNLDDAELKQGILSGNTVSFSETDVDVTIPMDQCESITHLCVEVTLDSSADGLYVDPNQGNNYICKEFGPADDNKIGKIPCNVDIGVSSFTIGGTTAVVYNADQSQELIANIQLQNSGTDDLPIFGNHDNFALTLFVTDNLQLESSTNDGLQQTLNTEALNMNQGINAGANLNFDDVTGSVTISGDTCFTVNYLCAQVTKPDSVPYKDIVETNNDKCILFGPRNDGLAGKKVCTEANDGKMSASVVVTFRNFLINRWPEKTAIYRKAVSDAVNVYCNNNFEECCPGKGSKTVDADISTPKDVTLTESPEQVENNLRVVSALTLNADNPLCSSGTESRRRRSIYELFLNLVKRDTGVTIYLSVDVLNDAVNDQEDEIEQAIGYLISSVIQARNETQKETKTGDKNKFSPEPWLIVVIAVCVTLGIAVISGMIYLALPARKRNPAVYVYH